MTLVTSSVRGVAAAFRGLATVVGAVLAGAAVMVVVLLAAVAVTLTTGAEIGRASCRERVCDSV